MTKSADEVIISKENKSAEVQDVHYVGKINREIYKCVSKDIVTDDVIITDERIQHIIEGHQNDYEQYCLYMQQIVEHPE